MGWAAGFQAGTNLGNTLVDTYNKGQLRRAGEEMAQLGPQAGVTQGKGLQITAPDGTVSTAVVDPSTGADFNSITKQYTDAGYKVAPVDAPQYIARSGSMDTGAASGSQSTAMHNAGGFNVDHLNQMANIYAKYGEPDKASAMIAQAGQLQRQNLMDDHQNQTWDREQAVRDAIKAAGNDPAKIQAALALDDPIKAAQYHAMDTQGQSQDIELQRKKAVRDAIAQTQTIAPMLISKDKGEQAKGYQTLIDMYNSHPEFNDGVTATLHQDASGHFIMMKADASGKPTGAPEILTPQTAMGYLQQGQTHLLSIIDPEGFGQKQQQIDQTGLQIKQTGDHYRRADANDAARTQILAGTAASEAAARAAMTRAARMGTPIATDQGYVVPIMGKDGSFTLKPLTMDGKPLNAAPKPIDAATHLKIISMADEAIAADKTLRGASPDRIAAKRSQLVNQYTSMIQGGGGAQSAAGFDPRAGLAAVQHAAPARAPTPPVDDESQYADKPAPQNVFQQVATGLRGY